MVLQRPLRDLARPRWKRLVSPRERPRPDNLLPPQVLEKIITPSTIVVRFRLRKLRHLSKQSVHIQGYWIQGTKVTPLLLNQHSFSSFEYANSKRYAMIMWCKTYLDVAPRHI
jgi:hypothetical protein